MTTTSSNIKEKFSIYRTPDRIYGLNLALDKAIHDHLCVKTHSNIYRDIKRKALEVEAAKTLIYSNFK